MLVHLPIGILVLGVAMHWLSQKARFASFAGVVPAILLAGVATAAASSISGLLLSQSGDYEAGTVQVHQWLGLATTACCIGLYFMVSKHILPKWHKAGSALLLILLTLTGHWGGTLTHGENYLLAGLKSTNRKQSIPPIANVQEAVLYKDAIQPLLEARCYSCHGQAKMKGKLRLDSEAGIMKGGEEGKALVPGQAGSSAMIERLLLPADDDKHMPPKEKPQLTRSEIDLLHWWISSGASFTAKVKDLPQSPSVKPLLIMLQQGSQAGQSGSGVAGIPDKAIDAADAKQMDALRQTGAVVLPVAANSNYLSISLSAVPDSAMDKAVELLKPLQKHIVWLYAGRSALANKHLATVGTLANLSKLHLQYTTITDEGLKALTVLRQLVYLNIAGTKISMQGLRTLSGNSGMQNLYLYQSGVAAGELAVVKKIFAKAAIDTGNYTVTTLAQDTTEVTEVRGDR